MVGLTFNEFYEKLYYGADIEFSLNNWHYMINCGWETNSTSKLHVIEVKNLTSLFMNKKVSLKFGKKFM